jgi:hypothetical protein
MIESRRRDSGCAKDLEFNNGGIGIRWHRLCQGTTRVTLLDPNKESVYRQKEFEKRNARQRQKNYDMR